MTDMTPTTNQRRQELIEKLVKKHRYVELLAPYTELNKIYGLGLEFDRTGINIHTALSIGLGFRAYCRENKNNPDEVILRVLENIVQNRQADEQSRIKCFQDSDKRHIDVLKHFFDFGIYRDYLFGHFNGNSYRDKVIDSIKNRTCTKETFDSFITYARSWEIGVPYMLEHAGPEYVSLWNDYMQNDTDVVHVEAKREKKKTKDISEREWRQYKRKNLNSNPLPERNLLQRIGSYFFG